VVAATGIRGNWKAYPAPETYDPVEHSMPGRKAKSGACPNTGGSKAGLMADGIPLPTDHPSEMCRPASKRANRHDPDKNTTGGSGLGWWPT
jgi:hypothetical protein